MVTQPILLLQSFATVEDDSRRSPRPWPIDPPHSLGTRTLLCVWNFRVGRLGWHRVLLHTTGFRRGFPSRMSVADEEREGRQTPEE